MRRREFIWLLSSGVAASVPWPVGAQQTSKVYRIATVSSAVPVAGMTETGAGHYRAFLGELRRLGYVEGENLVVERFSADGHAERYGEIVGDVIRRRPDAVLAIASILTEFKAQTTTLPIVGYATDMLGLGIVPSLARPGGNITGISEEADTETWGKRLSLLKEAVPRLSRVALLVTSQSYGQRGATILKEAGEKLGIFPVVAQVDSPFDETAYRRAFATMAPAAVEAIYVAGETENFANQRLIVELAQKYRLPAIYHFSAYVEIGGLMSYHADIPDLYRQAADQMDQILRGTKPGDIPVYQARKFDLLINLKTAKALGLDLSASLLAEADEVIE
jgi:putative ABC transport system substrate-binding protein